MGDVGPKFDVFHAFKMKRVKHDQIQSLATHYLKRRQYSGSELPHKKECRLGQSLQELSLRSSVAGASGMTNVLSFSSITGDATACDQQFTRLKNFISEAVDPYQSELNRLLYPMFIHVYLEMLCNGHKTPAHKFYVRHVALFKADNEHKDIIENLVKMSNRSDVDSCPEVSDFRDQKYRFLMTADALAYLLRYLKSEDNMIMLQIFNKSMAIEVTMPAGPPLELRGDLHVPYESDLPPVPVDSTSEQEDEVTLPRLRQSMKQVREGPPCLASICFHTFLNAYQGLCSACISSDRTLISGGFEDSTINLWSITPGHLRSEVASGYPNEITLCADFYEFDETDRKIEENETVMMRAHSGAVYRTCFTHDTKYLLSCSEDTTARLWDTSTHTNVVCYSGHNSPVWDIDASSVGSYFATASHDRTARLWCTDRTYPIRTFAGHTFDVDCVRFHPNCNYVATGSGDKTVRLWSLQDGKCVRLFQGHRGSVLAVAFSLDGKLLASAGDDRRVRVWDLTSGALYMEFRGHSDTIHSLCFNQDSSMLASGGLDCCIRIWDVRKPASTNTTAPVEGHTSPELLGAFPTKSAVIHHLQFAECNLLQAAGSM